MPQNRLRFQKGDLLAIGIVIALAVIIGILFLPKQASADCLAEIYQNGQLIRVVSLQEAQEFSVTGRYRNTITVEGGKISITASDCPGEDCVHTGFIGSSNRSIVCLPNSVEIRIVAEESDVDFVVG